MLTALRTRAADAPVLVAVDDLQWLDPASGLVLAFAWRRLRDEPVGLLLAKRTGERAAADLVDERVRRLDVPALSLGAVHRLLRDQTGLVLPRPALRRVHEVAAGNAFYALELGRALARLGAPLAAGEPLPVPGELRELLRDRIVALPAGTGEALAAAAAVSQPTRQLLAQAGFDDAALQPALEAHVLEEDTGGLRFAHPLLASAAYRELDEAERRALHRRLGDVVVDDEERARHLALAADGPNAEIAAALEAAAAHARSRGACAAAAELCDQACSLTPDGDAGDLHRRTIAAALHHFDAGDPARSIELLEQALAAAARGRDRAEALAALSRIHRFQGDQPRAAEVARRALTEAGADDRVHAEAAQGLASTLFYLREDLQEAVDLAASAASGAARSGGQALHVESLCLQGLLECLVGRTAAPATLRRAAKADEVDASRRVLSTPAFNWAVFRLWTDGPDAATLLRACREDVSLRGDESSAPMVLAQLALAEYLRGDWPEAAAVAEEAHELALQTGQLPMQGYALSTRALVRASLGLEADARADADRALALAGERGMAAARAHGSWALGLLELSLDRPVEVVQLLEPERVRLVAGGVGEPGAIRFVPDEIEALVALGREDEAATIADWFDERARALDRAWARAAALRCRGLREAARGEGDKALACFEDALALHEHASIPFERARTLLHLGATQRRSKQKSKARRTLGDALAIFEELGANLWSQKARAELGSIGGRTASGDELTPAEARVAALVAEGRDEPRGGGGALRLRPHGRVPPDADLPQARRPLPGRARAPPPGVARAKPGGFHVSGPFEAS